MSLRHPHYPATYVSGLSSVISCRPSLGPGATIFCLVGQGTLLGGGAFLLLCNICSWDEMVIFLSGASAVQVNEGLPEGGTLGTTLYTLLPDTLVKELLSLGHGVGLHRNVPKKWREHI